MQASASDDHPSIFIMTVYPPLDGASGRSGASGASGASGSSGASGASGASDYSSRSGSSRSAGSNSDGRSSAGSTGCNNSAGSNRDGRSSGRSSVGGDGDEPDDLFLAGSRELWYSRHREEVRWRPPLVWMVHHRRRVKAVRLTR